MAKDLLEDLLDRAARAIGHSRRLHAEAERLRRDCFELTRHFTAQVVGMRLDIVAARGRAAGLAGRRVPADLALRPDAPEPGRHGEGPGRERTATGPPATPRLRALT